MRCAWQPNKTPGESNRHTREGEKSWITPLLYTLSPQNLHVFQISAKTQDVSKAELELHFLFVRPAFKRDASGRTFFRN